MLKSYFILLILSLVLACQPSQSDQPQKFREYTIAQFMDNESVFGSSFSPDESKLLIGSDESGIFNAYAVDIETGERETLTESTDRTIRPSSYFPNDERILYMSDDNGDEIDHIFMRSEDGEVRELTVKEGAKAMFMGWAEDKQHFYYGSNERNPQFFDLYKMNIDDYSSEMLYQNDEGYNFGGMTDDERFIAFTKSVNTNDADLFILDRSTDELKKLNATNASHSVADFSVDDTKMYYLTDEGGEFSYLKEYDLATGESAKVMEEDWDIWYAYFSETGKYQVVGINQDAKTVVKIIDTNTGEEISLPDIEDQEITSVNISDSENVMAFYAGSSKATSDLYLYDFNTAKVKRLTKTLNEEIDSENLVQGKVIRYQSYDGLDIPAILYKPHYASATNPVPAVVQVHGGPGGQSRNSYSSLYQFLVNHGYAVLRVNNRGSSGYGKTFFQMDDQKHGDVDLKDCIEAKNYLASLDWVDKENIGILGGSYGGYMVMQAMTAAPEEFKVGVNIFGVTNWIRTLRSIPPWWASFKDALYLEMGDPYSQDSIRLREISPLFHADQIKHPVMVLQGAQDPRVLQVESDEMVDAMRANDVPVEYVLFEDEGHGFRKKENQIEGWSGILAFLDQHLKHEELID